MQIWIHPDIFRPYLTVSGLIHPNELPEGYELLESFVINEEWTVIDRWWTSDPIERNYRNVTRDGITLDEVRDQVTGEWRPIPKQAKKS
jgi:hypothetical protein